MSHLSLFHGNRPLYLNTLQIPDRLRLVVLAPHPDDFDAIGVALRFFRDNGNLIELGVLTSGASGVEDSFCSTPDAVMKARLREDEQRASCRFFGLPESQLGFLRLAEDEKGHLLESGENIERVRQYLLEKRPDLVFLPHGNDTNTGHQRANAIFHRIATSEGLSLAACLNRDPKTIHMRSDLYMLFGEAEAEWKRQLLSFHRSQQQRNLHMRGYGFDERILRMNRQSAEELKNSTRYAEAFELEFYGSRGE